MSYANDMPPKSPAALIKDTELASELRVSVMRLSRRLRAERLDEGLTPTQLAVLGTLDRGGLMTLGELAALEKVQPPSMTRTTAALEERGLIPGWHTPLTVDRFCLSSVGPAARCCWRIASAAKLGWPGASSC